MLTRSTDVGYSSGTQSGLGLFTGAKSPTKSPLCDSTRALERRPVSDEWQMAKRCQYYRVHSSGRYSSAVCGRSADAGWMVEGLFTAHGLN